MTLAILSALAEEQHGLVDAMQGMQCLRHAGRDFWLGRLHGHELRFIIRNRAGLAGAYHSKD